MRIGWLGRIAPRMDLGATYATKVYMQDFDECRGLLAGGNFDIPSNFTLGAAFENEDVTLALELHRSFFGNVPELGNGGLNSVEDPAGKPLGDELGSGFNWKHQANYRMALIWHATPRLDVRTGFAYGRVPQVDSSANTATFTMLAPSRRASAARLLSRRCVRATQHGRQVPQRDRAAAEDRELDVLIRPQRFTARVIRKLWCTQFPRNHWATRPSSSDRNAASMAGSPCSDATSLITGATVCSMFAR
jgi:hypothetical protein